MRANPRVAWPIGIAFMADATIEAERERSVRFFEVAFSLLALAAVALALLVHGRAAALGLSEQASAAATFALLLLASLDAVLLLVWGRLVRLVAGVR